VETPETLPPLPAAVEVAGYRIATEAMTNALRHAHAEHVALRVALSGGILPITVDDDGRGNAEAWTQGVGLTSMGERAAEIGGTVTAGPGPHDGRVLARLPATASGPARPGPEHPTPRADQLQPAP
jgi:two-component system NarL family sensor kinase